MSTRWTIKARCHCGRVRFSFPRPLQITTAKPAATLLPSASMPRRGACRPRYIPAADFTPHANQSDLGVYLWNETVLTNYFCRTCGVFTYIGDGEDAKDGYRVNLGCVQGLDTLALDIEIIDGKSLPVVGR